MSDENKVNTGHNIEDKELIKNARKPVGELGHKILDRMNKPDLSCMEALTFNTLEGTSVNIIAQYRMPHM